MSIRLLPRQLSQIMFPGSGTSLRRYPRPKLQQPPISPKPSFQLHPPAAEPTTLFSGPSVPTRIDASTPWRFRRRSDSNTSRRPKKPNNLLPFPTPPLNSIPPHSTAMSPSLKPNHLNLRTIGDSLSAISRNPPSDKHPNRSPKKKPTEAPPAAPPTLTPGSQKTCHNPYQRRQKQKHRSNSKDQGGDSESRLNSPRTMTKKELNQTGEKREEKKTGLRKEKEYAGRPMEEEPAMNSRNPGALRLVVW